MHFFQCKIFSRCEKFSGENIFGKRKYFQVFGCIMKIILENIFKCLVVFWKCYFPTSFSHFLSFQTNFIIEIFNNKLKRNKNQNKTFIELKKLVKRREREEERVIDNWGKGRGRLRKREIGHGWVMGAISPVLGCDETGAIWSWVLWCNLGLGAVVQSGVVVRTGVGCSGAIWCCGVRDLADSTLSSCSFFFFFSLEMVWR